MIDDLELDLPFESAMDRRRCNVNTKTKPTQ